MSDNAMRELYQEVILDHNKNPRNFRAAAGANRHAAGHNPLCGDEVDVTLRVGDDGRIDDVGFVGQGCAISKSSASLMTTMVKGKTVAEAEALFEKFQALVTSDIGVDISGDDLEALGKMGVFAGVRDYPARVKCASLAWHTLRAALADEGVVSTE